MLLLVLLAPLLIVVSYLGRYLLKRKLNPNEEYLNEIKEIDKIKRLSLIN